jgi:tRNA A-37 threonylcarbamoyl transferase component Bud32
MPLQPGATLENDKYRIEATIGRGGFGHVYRAREQLTGETVAIKELVPELVDDPQMVQRFIQEARATLRLTHPNIARTYNIFRDGDTYYLAMEYLAGGSLASRLSRKPGASLPVDEAVRIVGDLCTGLEYAHRQGVVHCDLKPANVLFDAHGTVRLADFGVAHVSEQLMTRRVHTGTGMAMGTVRYMAPEQLEGVRDDPRVDIYALGALLYEMLAGRPYLDFETETTPAAQMRNIQRIQSQPPRPLKAVNPAVPEWLAQVVEQALSKAPGERFATAAALGGALRSPALRQSRPVLGAAEGSARVAGRGAARPAAAQAPPRQVVVPPVVGPTPPRQVAATPQSQHKGGRAAWQWGLLGGVALLAIVFFVGAIILLLGGDNRGGSATSRPTSQPTAPPLSPTAPPLTPTPVPSSPTPEPDTPTPILPTPIPATPTPSNAEREEALLAKVLWHSTNGKPVFAYYTAGPPVIDGSLDVGGEWTGVEYSVSYVVHKPENWRGPADASAVFYTAWDQQFLYLGLNIRDDQHVQLSTGKNLFNGDDVEIQIDVDLSRDFNKKDVDDDDGQIGLAVRDLGTGAYEAYRWRPPSLEGPLSLTAAARPTTDGYVLEVAVPWWALNLSPQVEAPYGFCLNLSDTDTPGLRDQESMVSTSPNRKWGDPTTWGTLILVNW